MTAASNTTNYRNLTFYVVIFVSEYQKRELEKTEKQEKIRLQQENEKLKYRLMHPEERNVLESLGERTDRDRQALSRSSMNQLQLQKQVHYHYCIYRYCCLLTVIVVTVDTVITVIIILITLCSKLFSVYVP